MSLIVFLSAVSNEFHHADPQRPQDFQSYRQVLRQSVRILVRGSEARTQEDLVQGLGDLLTTLEDEVLCSHIVVHLIGEMAGAAPNSVQATDRLSEAEPLIQRALAIDEQSFGPEHPDVARDLNNLAQLLKATNRLSEAEPLMRRHLEIFCQFTYNTGHHHPYLLSAVTSYWQLLEVIRLPESDRWDRLLATGLDPTWLEEEGRP